MEKFEEWFEVQKVLNPSESSKMEELKFLFEMCWRKSSNICDENQQESERSFENQMSDVGDKIQDVIYDLESLMDKCNSLY